MVSRGGDFQSVWITPNSFMDNTVDKIIEYINQVDIFGYLLICVNLLLLVFAKVIIKVVYHQPEKVSDSSRKVMNFMGIKPVDYSCLWSFPFFSRQTK